MRERERERERDVEEILRKVTTNLTVGKENFATLFIECVINVNI